MRRLLLFLTFLPIVLITVGLTGCAAGVPTRTEQPLAKSGVIESIHQNSPRQVSALTGMLVGGVLGNGNCGTENRQVGLALGALGGAWAIGSSGHGVAAPGYRVTVRFDDGELGYFSNKDPVSIRVGQRVMVTGHQLYEPSAVADAALGEGALALRSSP